EFFYENIQGGDFSQTKSFPGLSEHSSNFTLYYETDVWGARLSTVYRSDYITDGDGVSSDADEIGFHATTNVDFSAFYQVNENLKVTLEGINLTNVAEEQYNDSADRIYNVTTSGRTFYLGASYKF
ncbi:MAG: TonB-dependent receptor, partial [Paraglaciecola sp.]